MALAMSCISCQQGKNSATESESDRQTTEVQDVETEPEVLSDSNPEFVRLAQPIKNYESDNSLEHESAWLKTTQKFLSAAYDSIYPGNAMGDVSGKADSMAEILEAEICSGNSLETTYDMLENLDYRYQFLQYKLASSNAKLIKSDSHYSDEVNSWMNLQTSLYDFFTNVAILSNFGGTIVNLNILNYRIKLQTIRLQSNNELIASKTSSVAALGNEIDNARNEFIRNLNARFDRIAENKELCEMADEYFANLALNKSQVLASLDSWLKVRLAKKDDTNNTIVFLHMLNKFLTLDLSAG